MVFIKDRLLSFQRIPIQSPLAPLAFLFSWCFLVSWCLSGESLSPLPCGPDLHQVDVVRVQPAVDCLAAYPKPPGEGGDIAPFRQQEFFRQWAKLYCIDMRPEVRKMYIQTREHSLPELGYPAGDHLLECGTQIRDFVHRVHKRCCRHDESGLPHAFDNASTDV